MVYDFRKTLTSRLMILVFTAFILLGAFIVTSEARSGVAFQGVSQVSVPLWDYYTGTGYRFLGYSYDLYGAPVAGVNYNVTAYVGTSTLTAGGLTNSSGYASFFMKLPANNCIGISGTVTLPSSIANEINGGSPLTFQGQLNKQCNSCSAYTSQAFSQSVTSVIDPSDNTKTDLVVAELGSNGAIPTKWGVYYEFTSAVPSPQEMQQLNESQMQLLGHLDGVQAVLPTPAPPSGAQNVLFGIFTADGNLADSAFEPVQQLVQPCQGCQNANLWGYPTASGFSFLGYAFDQYGVPVVGVNYNISLSVGTSSYTGSGLTNSSGYASIVVTAPSGSGAGAQATITFPGQKAGGGQQTKEFQIKQYSNQAAPNSLQQIFSNSQGYVINPSNQTQLQIDVIDMGPNGSAPSGSAVYYAYLPTVPSQQSLQQMTESQMKPLGTLQAVHTVLSMPPSPPTGTKTLVTATFTSTGALESIQSGSPPQVSTADPSFQVANALFPDFLIVTPFVGLIAAVIAYGGERATGVLESVLTRPVSRSGLAVSRYISVLIALGVGSLAAVLVVSSLAVLVLHASISPVYQLALVLGVFVEASAFAGIIFVLSRLFKSLAIILGSVLVVYFFTNFFPLFFSTAASVYQLVNPARYVLMVLAYLSRYQLIGPNGPSPFDPASVGLTPLTLVAAAALWIAIPFGAFLYLSVKRD